MFDWLAFNFDALLAYLAFGILFAFGNELGHVIKRWVRRLFK